MHALILAAALAAPRPAAAALDADTAKEIPRFVKLDVAGMTPAYIEHMVAVDAADVPAKYRKAFEAKKLELYTMKQLGEGKRKGTIRMPDKDCSIPKEGKSDDVKILLMSGYVEIYDNEETYLEEKTRCSQREMMCEFSLQVVHEHVPKKKEVRTRYFLYPKDALYALVEEYRARGGNHDTAFFGSAPFPTCN